MRQIALLSVFCLSLFSALGQRQARISIPMQLEVGSNFSKLEHDSVKVFSQNPGIVLSLHAGIGFRVQEKFSFSAMGGFLLDGYIFDGEGSSYNVYNLVNEVRFNANYLLPKPNKYGTQWHIGSDFGYTFYGADSISSSQNGVTYETSGGGKKSFFIGPEIGVTNSTAKGSLSLLISYVYHFEDQITLQTKMYSNQGSALAAAKGDYLTLRFRYMLDVVGHKPFQTLATQSPEDYRAFKRRETVTKQKFTAKHNKLVLQLWDNATEDGDSVSVMVNGAFIAKDLLLSRSKSKLIIRLDEGVNTITIFAHNEGTISPNTASCQIRSGLRKKQFTISTSMKRNEAIEVFF